MMQRWIVFLLLGMAGTTAGQAQVRPLPGSGDPRIQSIDYHPDQVVLIESAPGYQITVELAADELIESVAVGNSSAWQVTASHSGDHLFVKPLQPDVSTNMTVVTSNRIYAFDLVSLAGPSPGMAYTVQFHYPTAQPRTDEFITPGAMQGRYKLSGSRALRPSSISDDGEHTYIRWPPRTPLPAIYVRDDRDREALVNGGMRGDVYVIDSVHRHVVFRLDDHVARADRIAPRKIRR